jgi:hypothetical protein
MADPSLDAIQPDATSGIDESAQKEQEELLYYRRGQTLQLDKLQHELESLKQDTALRKKFARRISLLVVAWLFVVLLMLGSNRFAVTISNHSFRLSDNVLLALVGSTTANVLGIFVIVIHYLFPDRRPMS